MNQKEKRWFIFYIALAVGLTVFLFVQHLNPLILWWQEHFQKDLAFVAELKRPEGELLFMSLRSDLYMLIGFAIGACLVGATTIYSQKNKKKAPADSVKKALFSRKGFELRPIVYFSYILFFTRLIQVMKNHGFPYTYGPLFLILPLMVIVIDFIFVIKNYDKAKKEEGKEGME